jgi:hypothetical protein
VSMSIPTEQLKMTNAALNSALNQNQNVITQEAFCDALEEGTIQSSLDIGSAIIHKVLHPVMGAILLIGTMSDYVVVPML